MLVANETEGNMADVFHSVAEISDDAVGLDFRAPRYWRALIALASREQRAADWLRESRIRAYWPNYSVSESVGRQANGWRARGRRLRAISPGFVFVAVPPDSELELHRIVEDTPGIIGYMRDGTGLAATITEHDIRRIREIEGDHNRPPPAKHVHSFRIGQKVRFKIDRGLTGKIVEFCADGRIGIEAEKLLGGATVKAWPHQIEAM